MDYRCPLCAGLLRQEENVMRCAENHSFDIARQGYINLLSVQQKHSKNPGDTKEQVLARRTFLESGAYEPIVNALCDTAARLGAQGPILDVGCGEGYYSSRLAASMGAELTGLDISKEAVRFAAAKYKSSRWLCATAAKLPVFDGQVGTLTSLFALTMEEEFHRVLKKDGLYFQVLAAQDHLLELKKIIYPELKFKEKDSVPELAGFRRVCSVPIRFSFTAEGEQVRNLLYMTPHLFRISKEGARALESTQSLTDTASCMLNVFQPL